MNRIQKWIGRIGVLIALCLGYGCHPKPTTLRDHTQLIRVNIGDEPQVLDPRKARNLQCCTILTMLFEGMTRINADNVAELAAASKIDVSEDLKTYTMHLNENHWSNGNRVKASDFAYAWKTILSPSFPSDIAFHFYVIKNAKAAKEGTVDLDEVGIKVVDEYTLQVELENPTPYFLQLLASAPFFPVNQSIDEKNPAWSQSANRFVSNGPFLMQEWNHQSVIILKRNSAYRDAAHVNLEAIVLVMVQENAELMMFEKKEIDWAGSPLSTLPVDALKELKTKNCVHTKEMLGTYFLRANTLKAPFDNSLFRRAFALAVDRKSIVDHVTQGNQIPATGLVPLSFGLQKSPYFADANVAEAKKLFEAGLTAHNLNRESLPEISLLYRASDRNHLIAQAIQQQWNEAFGVRIRLESLESKVYFDRVSKGDFHLAAGSWVADFADPINFLEVFKLKNGGSNNTYWENASYGALLEKSFTTADPRLRDQLLHDSEAILMDEMPIIPIFYFTMLYMNQPHLKDVVLSPMGIIDFKWASSKENQ